MREMSGNDRIEVLIEQFRELDEPRVEGRTDHDLLDILVLALCAVMAGAEGWDDIEDWGRARESWLRRYLKLRNGIPGHDTIRRVFEAISPQQLDACFAAWMAQVCPAVAGRVIAIDGKSLRGAACAARGLRALHQVSAYAAEYGLTLGQRACEEKSNEITAIGDLLPTLALDGAVVTIDAMGCQTAIAEKIIEREADYVLGLKENQGHLYEDVERLFADLEGSQYKAYRFDYEKTVNKDHGRIEIRE
jgi:predicted transposase YbfD/YdcC